MVVSRKHPKMIIFGRKTPWVVGETHHFSRNPHMVTNLFTLLAYGFATWISWFFMGSDDPLKMRMVSWKLRQYQPPLAAPLTTEILDKFTHFRIHLGIHFSKPYGVQSPCRQRMIEVYFITETKRKVRRKVPHQVIQGKSNKIYGPTKKCLLLDLPGI